MYVPEGVPGILEEWPKNELRKKKTNSIAKKSDELLKKVVERTAFRFNSTN